MPDSLEYFLFPIYSMKIANTLVSSSLKISTAIFNVSVLGMHTAITLRYKPYQRSTVAPSKFTAISRVSAFYFFYSNLLNI